MCLTACGAESAGDSSELPALETGATVTIDTAPPMTEPEADVAMTIADAPVAGCAPFPHVELRSDADVVAADEVYYGESSPTCGFNGDGNAMFDDTYRPERALVASNGRFEIAVDQPGAVTVDVRVLQPDTGLARIDPGGQVLSPINGRYSLALPGAGCFVVTIGFNTETQSGQYTALAASSSDAC